MERIISAAVASPEVRRILGVLSIAVLAAGTIAVLQEPDATSRPSGRAPDASPSVPAGSSSPTLPETSPTPAPVETPGPTFLRYEVGLAPGQYALYRVDDDGSLTAERSVGFDRPSHAPVDRVESDDGQVHWRTVVGGFTGWSYVPGESGPFTVREVLRWPDGTVSYREVDSR